MLSVLILCDCTDCSPPGSSVHGILQAKEYWSGLPCHPAVDLPDLEIDPASLSSPALAGGAGGFFTTSTTKKDKDSLITERMPHKVEREMSQCSPGTKDHRPSIF